MAKLAFLGVFARALGLFAVVGSLVSGAASIALVIASPPPPEAGPSLALIPIWLLFSLAFSLPAGLPAILGAGWLAAFGATRVKSLPVYLASCATVSGLLVWAGEMIDLRDEIMGTSFMSGPSTSQMTWSWVLAGLVCAALIRRGKARPGVEAAGPGVHEAGAG
ncbi:MAG: hypothetical protein QM608_14620 [Caulobacter sp.]